MTVSRYVFCCFFTGFSLKLFPSEEAGSEQGYPDSGEGEAPKEAVKAEGADSAGEYSHWYIWELESILSGEGEAFSGSRRKAPSAETADSE